jgi:transcriptional regulator with XRE-family HTH domain
MAQRTGRPRGLTPDGEKIRRLRVDRGLTTAELAAQVGRHPQSIRHSERGGSISDVFASRLARALGISVKDLLADDTGSDAETKVPAA